MTEPTAYALYLDFDGTLVEIAPKPDQVRVDPALAPALERLRARLGGALAIVTGRPIGVIDDFLAPVRFDVAGLHGVERRVDGVVSGGSAEDHPALRAQVPALHAAVDALEHVLIEDKGASVAVHWRLATPSDAARAEEAVKAAADALGGAYRLQLGKAVGEIVPASATKGHAIRALSQNPPMRAAGRSSSATTSPTRRPSRWSTRPAASACASAGPRPSRPAASPTRRMCAACSTPGRGRGHRPRRPAARLKGLTPDPSSPPDPGRLTEVARMFEFPVLVGDIGGTNARFALLPEAGVAPVLLSARRRVDIPIPAPPSGLHWRKARARPRARPSLPWRPGWTVRRCSSPMPTG